MASPIVPPFAEETARLKVQAAEDGWNSRDPERVALAYIIPRIQSGATAMSFCAGGRRSRRS
jgi:nuclear transport factor 2 (NTF2) superfamily protein